MMFTVIVLIGGSGERFRGFLDDAPKPLIKVKNRSQLFWSSKGAYLSYKPDKFIFATRSGLIEKVTAEIKSFEFLSDFEVVDVGESTLGPAHTLKLALDSMKYPLDQSHVVVADNDCFNLLKIDLKSADFPFVTLTASNNPQHCFVKLTNDSNVVGFYEKERVSTTAVSGNYGFIDSMQFRKTLSTLLVSVKSDREPYLSDLMSMLLNDEPIKGFEVNEYFSLGTPSEISLLGGELIDFA